MTRHRSPKWLQAARTAGATGGDWLGRALPRSGVLPPPVAEAAIRAGRCRVNGAVVTDPFAPVAKGDQVELDGQQVSLGWETIVLMFHKPAGIVVAAQDRQGTVFEALQRVLPPELASYGWHAVGRLDRETTGLLLFSNDEAFVAHVTSPQTELPKTYVATTDGTVRDEQVAVLLAGVEIEDGPARALSARRRGPREIELVITEGRHHQVRQMLNAVRLAIRSLRRESIGELVLDVPEGELRRLRTEEIREALRYSAIAARGG